MIHSRNNAINDATIAQVDQQIAELNAAGASQYRLDPVPDTNLYRIVIDEVPGPSGSLKAVSVWLSYEIFLLRIQLYA